MAKDRSQTNDFSRSASFKEWVIRLIPVIILIINLLNHRFLPNKQASGISNAYTIVLIAGIVIYSAVFILSLKINMLWIKYRNKAILLTAAFLLLTVWDLATLKSALLRLPFFPGPDKVLHVFASDWQLLLTCVAHSFRLLLSGYVLGALMGLVTGVCMGWYQRANFWISPLLKIIGPIPATAWLPIAMVSFPTSFSASVFLIALAVWFPVTVMTSSGIANVGKAYFEVAKTLGGDQRYMIFKVAIPAAAPMIFIGLFMGMGASFLTLVAAEMLGVKAGLGWYINWAQGWAEYHKVYASLIVIAMIFSSMITLLFKIKDRLLSWQKGLIRW